MTSRVRGSAHRSLTAAFLAGMTAILAAACNTPAASRPSDPRAIAVDAVAATAAVTTLRLHIEVATTTAAAGNQAAGRTSVTVDADVDLPTRQFAGSAAMQMAPMQGGIGGPLRQVSDVIVTSTATFDRDSSTGRWRKFPTNPGGGFCGGPTNAEIAAAVAKIVADPSTRFEAGEAASCTLGTCDRVIVRVPGASLGVALGALFGVPVDQALGQAAIPDVDVDVLVDQATSIISEVRAGFTTQGTTVQILLALSNPGQPVQIVPPPPALTDDFGANGGFDRPVPVETTLEEVGATLPPSDPESPEP